MITFKLDELTPCLKLVETGEIYDTEIIRIKRRSVLQKFNSRTGWHCNWAKFDDDTMVPIMEVYNYDDNGEEY